MGEINDTDKFGSFMAKAIKHLSLKINLEIGSSDGSGSTQCFIEGMKDFDHKELTCIEIMDDKFLKLKAATNQYSWVNCVKCSTVNVERLKSVKFNDIWDSKYNGIKLHRDGNKDLCNTWYNNDIATMSMFKKGFLESNNKKYDSVLIDGGEFVGYQEFKLLENNVNVFFLDDCYTAFKTKQIVAELTDNKDWECIAYDKHTRNGFAAFKRKVFI